MIKKYPAVNITEEDKKVYCGDDSIKEYEERQRQEHLKKMMSNGTRI